MLKILPSFLGHDGHEEGTKDTTYVLRAFFVFFVTISSIITIFAIFLGHDGHEEDTTDTTAVLNVGLLK